MRFQHAERPREPTTSNVFDIGRAGDDAGLTMERGGGRFKGGDGGCSTAGSGVSSFGRHGGFRGRSGGDDSFGIDALAHLRLKVRGSGGKGRGWPSVEEAFGEDDLKSEHRCTKGDGDDEEDRVNEGSRQVGVRHFVYRKGEETGLFGSMSTRTEFKFGRGLTRETIQPAM